MQDLGSPGQVAAKATAAPRDLNCPEELRESLVEPHGKLKSGGVEHRVGIFMGSRPELAGIQGWHDDIVPSFVAHIIGVRPGTNAIRLVFLRGAEPYDP